MPTCFKLEYLLRLETRSCGCGLLLFFVIIYSRVCMLVYRVILYPLNIQFGQLIYTGKSMHTISTSNRLREASPGTMKYET